MRVLQCSLFVALLVAGADPGNSQNDLGARSGGGTGSIAGRVVPPHDHSFTLATARIPELGLRVEVAGDGSFRFESVRSGTHLLEVRVPTLGRTAEQVTVRPGEETALEIEILPGSHFEEVVVLGSEVREALDFTNPVTSLSGDELLLRQEASLGETLSQEPGISSTFFGPGASRPVIRGFTGDRVRVLEGGIGTGDASAVSADHAVTTDPSQAERIEVLRGPATLLYGSSAIGGAVNVVDGRIPTERATSPVTGTIDLRGGSVADERLGSVTLGGGGGEWAWHLQATARETDDYEVPGAPRLEGAEHGEEGEHDEEGEHGEEEPFGFVPNTDLETRGGRAGVTRFFGDRGFLGISVSGFDTEYGLPGGLEHGEHGEDEHDEQGEDDEHGEHDDEHGEVPVRIDMEQRRLDLRGAVTQGLGFLQALKVRVGVTDYEHVELEGAEEGTFFFNDFLEARVEAVQKRRGRHSGSFGVQFSDRELEAIGAEAFIPPTDTRRLAAFGFQEIETGEVRWQFGARYEDQDQDAIGFGDRSHDGLSGSAGLVWDFVPGWALAGSLARSVRLPASEELFSDGPHIASQAFEIGDPNLDEEVGLGVDLSLRRTEGPVTGEISLFRQDFEDFIFQAFTGEVEDGFPVVVYRQRDAEFTGAEVDFRFELYERDGHHLHLRTTGDIVRAELDSGDDLPRIPPMRLGAGLHYHSERWSGMAEVRWVDDQDRVSTNETPTDGYTMVNASVGYRFIFGGQLLDLMLRGRNLTDEEARSHTSFLKDVAPLPGRDVSLSLRYWF